MIKKITQFSKRVMILCGLFFMAVFLYFLLYAVFMYFERQEVSSHYAISEFREVELAGYRQKILMEGKRKDDPIILYLHGGPGTSLPFNTACRGLLPAWTDHHIVVFWDQLGSGINNRKIESNVNTETYVQMTTDLIRQLKQEFPDNPIIVLGISWGSLLAAKAADRLPNEVDMVVTYGQITDYTMSNQYLFDALETSNMSETEKDRMEEIRHKKEYTYSEIALVSGWLLQYTDSYWVNLKLPDLHFIVGMLSSPDLAYADKKAFLFNGHRENSILMKEVVTQDLRPILNRTNIPYHIYQGERDLVTPTGAVEDYMKTATNQNLQLHILDDVGHIPDQRALRQILEDIDNEKAIRQ